MRRKWGRERGRWERTLITKSSIKKWQEKKNHIIVWSMHDALVHIPKTKRQKEKEGVGVGDRNERRKYI